MTKRFEGKVGLVRGGLVALAAMPLCAIGCGMSNPIDDDPLAVVLQQQAAWNKGDIIGFMAGYHRAPDTTFSNSDGMISGWDTVLEGYTKRYPDRAAMGKLAFTDLRATSLGSDAALVTGQWRLEREKDRPGGVFTLVMKRFPPAGWRIVHDHTSAFSK